MRRGKNLSAIFLVIVISRSPLAASAEIYQWVDEEGVVHYSDTRPTIATDAKTLLVNASNPPGYDPADDPYSIANQAKRMNTKWRELAEARAEREEKRRAGSRQYAQYQPPRYNGWRYSAWPRYYAPIQPLPPTQRPLQTLQRQANALQSLNLTGPRSYSINSAAHQARVASGRKLLASTSRPALSQN